MNRFGPIDPNHMQNDVRESRVVVVMVRLPIRPGQIDFDVARADFLPANLHHRAAKVRSGFVIPKTGMQDAHWTAIDGLQLIASQSLMVPDRLQEALGRIMAIALAQKKPLLILLPPFGVQTWSKTGHAPWFSGMPPQSQGAIAFPQGPEPRSYL
jgi:hypothetical protein